MQIAFEVPYERCYQKIGMKSKLYVISFIE